METDNISYLRGRLGVRVILKELKELTLNGNILPFILIVRVKNLEKQLYYSIVFVFRATLAYLDLLIRVS